MYLHIGKNYLIKTKYIVGIFDIDNTTVSSHTRSFLSNEEKKHEVINVTSELPRSFIIYKENGKITVYITQFNTATLQKRNNIKYAEIK